MAERTVVIDSDALRDIGGFLPLPRGLARCRSVTQAAKVAYAQLIAYGWEREFASPAQDRLADDLGMSERNVRYVLDELRRHGLVEWRRRGRGEPNLYIVRLPANFAALDRQPAAGQEASDRQPAAGPSIGEKREKKKESEVHAKSAGSRTTWLTPYADAWKERFGGEMPCAKFSQPLSKAEKQLGPEEGVRRWKNYLGASGTWASAQQFVSQLGMWTAQGPAPTGRAAAHPDRPPAAGGDRFAGLRARQAEQAAGRGRQ